MKVSRFWPAATVLIAVLVLSAGCSSDQLQQFVADGQPVVATTVRDGRAIVQVAVCGEPLMGELTIRQIANRPNVVGTSVVTQAKVPARAGRSGNGVTEFDVTDVMAQAGLDPLKLPDTDNIEIGYETKDGRSSSGVSPAIGPWAEFPIGDVNDMRADSQYRTNPKEKPIRCKSTS